MTEVDTITATIACREALTAALHAAGGDRSSAAGGLVGALVLLASTSANPTEMLAVLIESLEAARPVLATIGARAHAAAAAPQSGGPS